jgi:ribosomal protein S18 acetylase RimI-like enzyme
LGPAPEEVCVVVDYRGFRNTDPPGLAVIWNEAFTGRGEVRLRHSSPLENYVFSKPYFDSEGLIVAVEDDALVGFAHAGFGPNAAQTALSRTEGVICLVGVRPSHRGKGIGSELLRRCESYLTSRGAQTLYAGPMSPFNPFYFALYGGSELPGFLKSSEAAEPFLRRHGYAIHDTCLVFQRLLSHPVNVVDGRFPGLRRQYDVRIAPRAGVSTWWQECVLGPVEVVDFRLEDKTAAQMAARTSVWEMDLFSWRWNQPAVGIVDVQVLEEHRRQGMAKFLLSQTLRYLQEQFFGLVEVQTMEHNQPAVKLYTSLGFEQVDTGHIYKKVLST